MQKDALTRRKSNARTSLPRSRRAVNPMAMYDRLPTDLRVWLRQAVLPWSPRSALRVWRSALEKHGNDPIAAQAYLGQLEQKMLKQDSRKTWGFE
nr:DUF6525 family protein [Sulfitobacter undariae]